MWPRDWSSDVCSSDLSSPSTLVRTPRTTSDRSEVVRGVRTSVAGDDAALYNSLLLTVQDAEIGRASCRERVERTEGGGAVERKEMMTCITWTLVADGG